MKYILLMLGVLISLAGTPALAEMSVKLEGGWDGKKVPEGQQCSLQGGNGSTPPMRLSNIPKGAKWIYVEYNDRDYQPLSSKGGHGIIGYPVKGPSAHLYPVQGMKPKLKGGAEVIKKARSTGKYSSQGYLPPCSGGRNSRYFAVIKAIDLNGKVLEKIKVNIGRY